MTTLFTRIIAGELPGRFVWRDATCVGFLTVAPLGPGHTLVVPRREVAHWVDMADDEVAHVMRVARHVGAAIDRVWNPRRVGLLVAGYEVPHAHVHVFPSWSMDDFDLARAGEGDSDSDAALDEAHERLGAALRAAGHEEAVSPS